MSERYDSVVIGAGSNGLTTASLLAARGRSVLVLEARDICGGLAAGAEFHPGYRHTGLLHETSLVRPWVVEALGLERHGLARTDPPDLLAPQAEGTGLVLSGKGSDGLSSSDAESLAKYNRFIDRIAPVLRRFLDRQPADLTATGARDLVRLASTGMALRRLGKRDMMEVLRIVSMPVADWLDDWFTSDLLKSVLAGPAIYSTCAGPRSPGSNANLLFAAASAARPIAGGPQALAAALEKAARAAGVEIRTGAVVEKILLERERVAGVEFSGGERVSATSVFASCDPKQAFLGLLPRAALSRTLRWHIENFRSRGTTAKIHLALTGYPEFSCRKGERFERVRTGESLDELERAFDAVKYRRFSERPVLDICFPTVADAGLAPPGHHVASILVSFAPFELDGGWTETSRKSLYRAVLDVFGSYAPGVEDLVVGHEVSSPADLAFEYRLTGGHLFHGEHALDQILIRPAPDCARYETPFAGLYLCGSGSHPGGGLTCAPGALAAAGTPL